MTDTNQPQQWRGDDWVQIRGITVKVTNSIGDALVFSKDLDGGLVITFAHNNNIDRHQFVSDSPEGYRQFMDAVGAL